MKKPRIRDIINNEKAKSMRLEYIGLILVGIFCIGRLVVAEMASDNFQIKWDSINFGGSDSSASASYILRDTLGNAGAGESESATYILRAGYRAGIFDEVISFEIFSQDNASEKAADALAGTTVTTNTDGFAVGDFIAVIENYGEDQVSATGQITAIGAGTLTVDEWKNGGVAPIIDGNDDFVYKLEGTTADLSDLDESEVNTAIICFEITADVDSGYSIQVFEDGDLRDGAADIDPVADGEVTAGNEEYGGRSSDTTLNDSTFDTEDTAFTENFQEVADENEEKFSDRNFITLKASITDDSESGDYAQVLTFIASGNF